MRFEYTGRHVEVTPAIRKHVEDHFRKLDHIFNKSAITTHVIIEVEKNRHIGEIIVHWRDHTLTAKDINVDMYMALTRAITKNHELIGFSRQAQRGFLGSHRFHIVAARGDYSRWSRGGFEQAVRFRRHRRGSLCSLFPVDGFLLQL